MYLVNLLVAFTGHWEEASENLGYKLFKWGYLKIPGCPLLIVFLSFGANKLRIAHPVFLFTSLIYFIAALLTLLPPKEGHPEALDFQEGMYYYDQTKKRIAINTTFQQLNGEQHAMHLYIIQDYGKVCDFILSFIVFFFFFFFFLMLVLLRWYVSIAFSCFRAQPEVVFFFKCQMKGHIFLRITLPWKFQLQIRYTMEVIPENVLFPVYQFWVSYSFLFLFFFFFFFFLNFLQQPNPQGHILISAQGHYENLSLKITLKILLPWKSHWKII